MMTTIRQTILFLFAMCFLLSRSFGFGIEELVSTPDPKNIEIKRLESINAVQVKLSNGMTFALKTTDSDTDEVFFKIAALGGFGSLSQKNFYSGAFADKIALESGMGGMTSDQVSVFLYENALEFVLQITPFSRVIEGEGQVESIEAFLRAVNMVFTQQQFTEEGFAAAKVLSKDIINKLNKDSDHAYEVVFLRVNTQNFPPLRQLTVDDVEKVKFDKAKAFFQRSFSDPGEFFGVITGNFDVEKTIQLIEKYLGVIPRPEKGSRLKKTFAVPFPQGITETTINLPKQSSCLTHITFPLQIEINETTIGEIAFMSQVIEARLRRVIMEKMNFSYGVDVSYEFPIYPFLVNPWISIRYRCEDNYIRPIKAIVLAELKNLQLKGVTAEEVAAIKKLEQGSQEFWLNDDFYLLSMLSNYYLWGWNPEKIDYRNTSIYKINVERVNQLLKKAINLNNYSIIRSVPAKE